MKISAVSSPSGVQCRAPAAKWLYHILTTQMSSPDTLAQIDLSCQHSKSNIKFQESSRSFPGQWEPCFTEFSIQFYTTHGHQGQADHPSRFSRDGPGLEMSVPESRTLSSGCQNVPVLALLG